MNRFHFAAFANDILQHVQEENRAPPRARRGRLRGSERNAPPIEAPASQSDDDLFDDASSTDDDDSDFIDDADEPTPDPSIPDSPAPSTPPPRRAARRRTSTSADRHTSPVTPIRRSTRRTSTPMEERHSTSTPVTPRQRATRRRAPAESETQELEREIRDLSDTLSPRRRAHLEDESEISHVTVVTPRVEAIPSISVIVVESDPEPEASDDEVHVVRAKKRKTDEMAKDEDKPGSSNHFADVTGTGDDSCSICFEEFTVAGEHRLVSLKCGHFFGDACIRKWIRAERSAGCPQCKAKSVLKDIRVHFGRTIAMTDNSELEQCRRELTATKKENEELQLNLSRLQRKIKELEKLQSLPSNFTSGTSTPVGVFKLFPSDRRTMSEQGGCRAFDFNGERLFVGSRSSRSGMFAQFCVSELSTSLKLGTSYPTHTQRMRLVAVSPFHATLILTVSEDGHAAVTDICANRKLHTWKLGSQGWSGCWLSDQKVAIGLQTGRVLTFDLSRPQDQEPEDLTGGDGRLPIINVSHFPNISCTIMCSLRRITCIWNGRIHSLLDADRDHFHKINCVATDLESRSIAVTVPAQQQTPTTHTLYRLVEEDGQIKMLEDSRWVSSSLAMHTLFTSDLFSFSGSLCSLTYQEDTKRVVVHDWSGKRRDAYMSLPTDTNQVTALRSLPIPNSPMEKLVMVLSDKVLYSAKLKHLLI